MCVSGRVLHTLNILWEMTCLCQSVEELRKPMKEVKYCTACARLLKSWSSAPDLLLVTFCNWRKNTNSRIQTSNNADVIAASFFVTKDLSLVLSLCLTTTPAWEMLGNVTPASSIYWITDRIYFEFNWL